MPNSATISPVIIDTLYEEALQLADRARAAFDLSSAAQDSAWPVRGPKDLAGDPAGDADERSMARIALSCEALRTTTRMMHAMAWLLNHRAYFRGELSAFQLRRFGRLPKEQAPGPAAELAVLDAQTRALVDRTIAFYRRLARLDVAFQRSFAMEPPALDRLRHRIDRAFPAF